MFHGSNPKHPTLPVSGVGGVSTPGAASEPSPALDSSSVVLPKSPLRPSCLLACAPPSSTAAGSPGLSSFSSSPGRLCVHGPSVPSFLGLSHPPSPACVRPVCAPLAGVRQAARVCARVAAGICVCELVSAWLTKAQACGEPREGRGGSAAWGPTMRFAAGPGFRPGDASFCSMALGAWSRA